MHGSPVGYYEQRRKGAGSTLDLPIETATITFGRKNCSLGAEVVLQECGQPYSPVSDWIKEVDVALEDEGQQYGNMQKSLHYCPNPHALA